MHSFLSLEQAELASRMHILVFSNSVHLTSMVRENLRGIFGEVKFISEISQILELLITFPFQILIVEL